MRSIQFAVSLVVLSTSFAARANDTICKSLESKFHGAHGEVLPETWDTTTFSDPARHDPRSYVYSVHAVTEKFVDAMKNSGTTALGQIKDLIFASTVTAEKPVTFMDFGYILDHRPSHVVGTSPFDTTAHFGKLDGSPESAAARQDELANYAKRYPVRSPSQILAETEIGRYGDFNNETLLTGTDDSGEPVKAAAVFVWGDATGKYPLDATAVEGSRKIVAFAKEHDLPVVVFRSKALLFEAHPLKFDYNDGNLSRLVWQNGFERHEINFEAEPSNHLHTKTSLLRAQIRTEHFFLGSSSFAVEIKNAMQANAGLKEALQRAVASLRERQACDVFCESFFAALL